MKRLKIMKAYAVLWLFIYFLVNTNLEAMKVFFFATLTFNLAVLTILTIGIIVIMRSSITLVMLAGTFGTLAYKKNNLTFYLQGIDKIMPANIAHMFHSRAEKGVLLFTSDESRAVVEWIDEKFSHQNRYINYFIGTSLMIGLLGTFTGLLIAIDQMGKIILSLSGDIDLGEVIRSFAGPLGGMATGFGSSLFGVVSAIILGLMGYILNKNQESLIEGVEDWLKGRIIDSGGATAASPALTGSSGEELPDHRSSFMDVFIDNISSLTKAMAEIAQTNERLHSITIASVQQARDEHELSYELFGTINDNLVNIDTNSKNTTTVLENRLSSLEEIITNGQKLALDDNKERLEGLRQELQNLTTILSQDDETENKNFTNLISSIDTLSSQVAQEMTLLGSIEKLNKIQIIDARKQDKNVQSMEQSIVASYTDSTELLEKQRAILELLVGKNDEHLEELRRISSMSGSVTGTISEKVDDNRATSNGFFSKFFG